MPNTAAVVPVYNIALVVWLTAGDIAIGSDEYNRTVVKTYTTGEKWNGIRVFSSGLPDLSVVQL